MNVLLFPCTDLIFPSPCISFQQSLTSAPSLSFSLHALTSLVAMPSLPHSCLPLLGVKNALNNSEWGLIYKTSRSGSLRPRRPDLQRHGGSSMPLHVTQTCQLGKRPHTRWGRCFTSPTNIFPAALQNKHSSDHQPASTDVYYRLPFHTFFPWGSLIWENPCCSCSAIHADTSSGRATYDYNSHSYMLIKGDNLEIIKVQGNWTITHYSRASPEGPLTTSGPWEPLTEELPTFRTRRRWSWT